MPSVARHVLVSGRVQGVGFRWYTRSKAVELRLAGWVANLPDGRVEAWLEGESEALESMLAWLAKGPPAARVTNVESVAHEPRGLTGFESRR
jgi:acylphosphatase